MKNYLKTIHCEPKRGDESIIWKISSEGYNDIFSEINQNYYSNETFVLMRNDILFSYKKSTYYKELDELSNKE